MQRFGRPMVAAMHRRAPAAYAASEIRHLLARGGCPICRAGQEAIERYLFWFFHESYGEPSVILRYVRSRGFCPRHLSLIGERGPQWQLTAIFSWIIADILRALDAPAPPLRSRFQQLRRHVSAGDALTRVLQPDGLCLLCEVEEEAASHTALMLLDVLEYDEDVRDRYAASGGCCLPHVHRVARAAGRHHEQAIATIHRVLRDRLASLEHLCNEFFRKADYRFAHEPKGEEREAWRQALQLFGYHGRATAVFDQAPARRAEGERS